jgi:hypothetical protein
MEVISFVLKENNNASFEGVFFLTRMKNGSQKQQRGSKTLNHAADLILTT